MVACWAYKAELRPTFSQMITTIERGELPRACEPADLRRRQASDSSPPAGCSADASLGGNSLSRLLPQPGEYCFPLTQLENSNGAVVMGNWTLLQEGGLYDSPLPMDSMQEDSACTSDRSAVAASDDGDCSEPPPSVPAPILAKS